MKLLQQNTIKISGKKRATEQDFLSGFYLYNNLEVLLSL